MAEVAMSAVAMSAVAVATAGVVMVARVALAAAAVARRGRRIGRHRRPDRRRHCPAPPPLPGSATAAVGSQGWLAVRAALGGRQRLLYVWWPSVHGWLIGSGPILLGSLSYS